MDGFCEIYNQSSLEGFSLKKFDPTNGLRPNKFGIGSHDVELVSQALTMDYHSHMKVGPHASLRSLASPLNIHRVSCTEYDSLRSFK